MLATDLHAHLEDLSSSLTQMIETVNSLSGPLSSEGSASHAEQPITQIAQILGSHLDSLQWIDGAVRDVESKVSEVEKRIKESNPISNTTSNPKSRGFGLR
jgi:nuclear pore complex protein Nup62